MVGNRQSWTETRAFLTRLARDTRGNTLALMAIAIIPLAGMVGGGVDISRMYIVKTRLQHACDAGALAGRKAMGGGTWTQTVNGTPDYPKAAADKFFEANYNRKAYGVTSVTSSFTESAGKVTGNASAELPMTLMKIFGRKSETLTVKCEAEMRLPNTDIMFVLDTTGSMGETPSGDSQTKLQSLKDAVKCFYEIVARLDTTEPCTTGTPSGGTGSQTQLRFGFVPYATNANVGFLLPTEYFADSWDYQSREAVFVNQPQVQWTEGTTQPTGSQLINTNNPSWSRITSGGNATIAANTNNSNDCSNLADPDNDTHTLTGTESAPYNQTTETNGTERTVRWKTKQAGWYYQYRFTWNSNRNRCEYQQRTVTYDLERSYSRTDSGTIVYVPVFDHYNYDSLSKDISGLKNGSTWNTSIDLPIGKYGAQKTISWGGCVEERATVRASNYSPIPADAEDLDIDQIPSAGDPRSLWGPVLPGMIYTRRDGNNNFTTARREVANEYGNSSSYSCPTEARKLQTWDSADTFEDYVDSLQASGNTYHDIGLIWGARLMSPTGLFKSENEFTPQGGEIERHLIFMTDGDPCTAAFNYQAYGVGWYDRRQTDPSVAPTEGCTTTGTLTQQVNARTAAICTAIKNKNITLWVITFGGLASNTVTRMTNCATPGRYFHATNAATLQATFKSIADQISALRLTS